MALVREVDHDMTRWVEMYLLRYFGAGGTGNLLGAAICYVPGAVRNL